MNSTNARRPIAAMKRLTEEQKKIVEENLGLAYARAKKMRKDSLPDDDKRQASVLGLIYAVMAVDLDKGHLEAHSINRIRKAVVEAESREHVIYVPPRVFNKNKRTKPGRAESMLKLALKSRRMTWVGDATSSEESRNSINWFRRMESALSRDVDDPAIVVDRAERLDSLKAEIRESMSELKPKQRAAVAGFLDGEDQAATAIRLGCSRQNISELKKSAFKKMRTRLSKHVEAST